MFFLTDKLEFPPVQSATDEGIVAVGGDLSVERLLLAYRHGIFPWFEKDELIIWWSPPERMVLYPENLRISKSLRQVLRSGKFKVTFNTAFDQVIQHCAEIPRRRQDGTWITEEMLEAYKNLHREGYAQSVEVWEADQLVGGLYGVDLGHVFCGESMFSKVSNASKVAFVHMVQRLQQRNYQLIDCQVYTDHLASLGAEEISREDFVKQLQRKYQAGE